MKKVGQKCNCVSGGEIITIEQQDFFIRERLVLLVKKNKIR